jgi:hypothetical protein
MPIRIEIQPDQSIEIMKSHAAKECNVFHTFSDIDRAMIVIRYWISKELELSNKTRFVSQITIEARKAFKQLNERSPYNAKR